MRDKSMAAFENLVRWFSIMLYIGIAIIMISVAGGILLNGSAQALCGGGLGVVGLLMLGVGYRERRKGNRIIGELQSRRDAAP